MFRALSVATIKFSVNYMLIKQNACSHGGDHQSNDSLSLPTRSDIESHCGAVRKEPTRANNDHEMPEGSNSWQTRNHRFNHHSLPSPATMTWPRRREVGNEEIDTHISATAWILASHPPAVTCWSRSLQEFVYDGWKHTLTHTIKQGVVFSTVSTEIPKEVEQLVHQHTLTLALKVGWMKINWMRTRELKCGSLTQPASNVCGICVVEPLSV